MAEMAAGHRHPICAAGAGQLYLVNQVEHVLHIESSLKCNIWCCQGPVQPPTDAVSAAQPSLEGEGSQSAQQAALSAEQTSAPVPYPPPAQAAGSTSLAPSPNRGSTSCNAEAPVSLPPAAAEVHDRACLAYLADDSSANHQPSCRHVEIADGAWLMHPLMSSVSLKHVCNVHLFA